jgi:NADP-dependent 3-hydroxy acid dehydrogenase YdfG
MCDIDTEMGQQRLQELTEEYGQGRVIFIEVDVRSYQQLEGDRNLLWSAEKRHTKYMCNFI